jgi:integrase
VGELGLNKLAFKPDPQTITFGELGTRYLEQYPFNKLSTRELHAQIIRRQMSEWCDAVAVEIEPKKLKAWFNGFDVESATRGKYKSVISGMYKWGQCEGLLPRGEQYNPCKYVTGREFSQVSGYEAMAMAPEDILSLLSELSRPEYEIALLVATCGLRSSEALGLKWRNILWKRRMIAIRQTFVHSNIQDGAKTKLSRSRVEAPKLLLDVLESWRKETMYADDEDYVFPSEKLGGKQPRSGSMLVEDYIRPAAIRAGIITKKEGVTYDRDGEVVKRFGFHILGRHSLATYLMDNQENPAMVQAIMRHSKMDMTLYYSHSQRKQKLAALDKVVEHFVAAKTGALTGA